MISGTELRRLAGAWNADVTVVERDYVLSWVLAEKLRAMLRRARARDLYDVWQLFTRYASALDCGRARDVLEEKARYKGFTFDSVAAFLTPRTNRLGRRLGKRRCVARCPWLQSTIRSLLRSNVRWQISWHILLEELVLEDFSA
jgi:hypothetical protein